VPELKIKVDGLKILQGTSKSSRFYDESKSLVKSKETLVTLDYKAS
jgi:hypothetical protein